jgi:hypothetical protein
MPGGKGYSVIEKENLEFWIGYYILFPAWLLFSALQTLLPKNEISISGGNS